MVRYKLSLPTYSGDLDDREAKFLVKVVKEVKDFPERGVIQTC
jgi:hypothetical protein